MTNQPSTIITDPNAPTIAKPDVAAEPTFRGTSLGDLVANVQRARAQLPATHRGRVVFTANPKGVELIARSTNQPVPGMPSGTGIRINNYRGVPVNISGQYQADQKEVFRVLILGVLPEGSKWAL